MLDQRVWVSLWLFKQAARLLSEEPVLNYIVTCNLRVQGSILGNTAIFSLI